MPSGLVGERGGHPAVVADLWYADGRERKPLPEWARFFIRIGAAIGACGRSDDRLVVAIAAPTRAYAAAFAALGAVAARAFSATQQLGPQEHASRLCSLEPGTPVFYVESGQRQKAVFLGCASVRGGAPSFRLQFERTPGARESGGLIRWLPQECAPRIRVADEEFSDLPRKQHATPIINNAAFVRYVLGASDLSEFALSARTDALIVGTVSSLRAEITGAIFATGQRAGAGAEGTINDVLRVHQFLADGEPHRSEVVKCSAEASLPTLTGGGAHAVVFDGSAGFLRLRDHFRQSHWILVLDCTDPNTADATEAFGAGYTQDRVADSGRGERDSLPSDTPPGVEMSAYRAERT